MPDNGDKQHLMTDEEFETTVRAALEELPDEIDAQIDNVAVVIEDRSDDPNLLGLYQGVPLTRRSRWYRNTPDQITIYREPIESICSTPDEARDQVRRTVLHEVGHYFGMNEQQLRDLGY